jgi:putative heme transporter
MAASPSVPTGQSDDRIRTRASRTPTRDVTGLVPTGLRVSAALAWRFIVVIAALYVLVWLAGYFSHLIVPMAIALLLTALMAPGVDRLVTSGVPRWAATVIVMIAGIAILGGLLTFVIITFANGLPQLQTQVVASLDQIRDWLTTGPLHLRAEQIQTVIDDAIGAIQDNQAAITQGAITTATTIGEVLTGFLLTVFILIFFLHDGPRIWRFTTRAVPTRVRDRVDVAGRRGFAALVNNDDNQPAPAGPDDTNAT